MTRKNAGVAKAPKTRKKPIASFSEKSFLQHTSQVKKPGRVPALPLDFHKQVEIRRRSRVDRARQLAANVDAQEGILATTARYNASSERTRLGIHHETSLSPAMARVVHTQQMNEQAREAARVAGTAIPDVHMRTAEEEQTVSSYRQIQERMDTMDRQEAARNWGTRLAQPGNTVITLAPRTPLMVEARARPDPRMGQMMPPARPGGHRQSASQPITPIVWPRQGQTLTPMSPIGHRVSQPGTPIVWPSGHAKSGSKTKR